MWDRYGEILRESGQVKESEEYHLNSLKIIKKHLGEGMFYYISIINHI